MADGNFNTKILPPGGYASGVRAGEARMKQRALRAFDSLTATLPRLSEDEKQALKLSFKAMLEANALDK